MGLQPIVLESLGLLLTVHGDTVIKGYDLSSLQPVISYSHQFEKVNGLFASPDGSWAVSHGEDCQLRLFKKGAQGKLLIYPLGARFSARSAPVILNRDLFATFDPNGEVTVRSAEKKGVIVSQYKLPGPFLDQKATLGSGSFMRSNDFILIGLTLSENKKAISVISTSTGREIGLIELPGIYGDSGTREEFSIRGISQTGLALVSIGSIRASGKSEYKTFGLDAHIGRVLWERVGQMNPFDSFDSKVLRGIGEVTVGVIELESQWEVIDGVTGNPLVRNPGSAALPSISLSPNGQALAVSVYSTRGKASVDLYSVGITHDERASEQRVR